VKWRGGIKGEDVKEMWKGGKGRTGGREKRLRGRGGE